MKKSVLKTIFSNYGILQVIFLSLVFMITIFLSFDPTNILKDYVFLNEAIKGALVVVLITLPILGFAGIKDEKQKVLDFVRVPLIIGTLLGTVGVIVAGLAKEESNLDFSNIPTLINFLMCGASLFTLVLQQTMRPKIDALNTVGPKKYFAALFAKYNIFGIIGVSLVLSLLGYIYYKDISLVLESSPLIVGVLLSILVIQLIFNSNDSVSLIDYILMSIVISFGLIIAYRGHDLNVTLVKYLLTLGVLLITIYLKAISFNGECVKTYSKCKKYLSSVSDKFDLSMPFVFFLAVSVILIITVRDISVLDVNSKLLNFIADNFVIIFGALFGSSILLMLIFRGFKKNSIGFVDYVIISSLIYSVFFLPFVATEFVVFDGSKINITFESLDIAKVLLILASFVVSASLFVVRSFLFDNVNYVDSKELDDEYNEDYVEEVIPFESNEINESEEVQTEEATLEVVEETNDEVIEETNENAETDELTTEENETTEAVEVEVVKETAEEVEEVQTEEVTIEPVIQPTLEDTKVTIEQEDENDDLPEEELDEEDDEEEEIDLSDIDTIDITNENGTRERSILTPTIQVLDEEGNPKKINRRFMARLMFASVETKEFYNEVKNYLMMYRAKGRLSSRCETFRYKGIMAKVVLAGKNIKAYLAISPKDLEGTKYHYKDVSEKSVYAEVPVLVKIASKRGLAHFKELVDFMMAARQVKPKKNFEPTDYLPELIPNGEAILSSLGLGTDYICDYVNVKSVPSDIPEVDNMIPVIAGTQLPEEPVEVSIYLDTLCTYFEDGEVITLEALKERRILRYGDILKVKARGTLDRSFTIYADSFESHALKMLMCTNCRAIKIVR